MSPAKALRLSIARAAEDLWDLAAAASGISIAEETLDDAIGALPEQGLIVLLDGPEGLVGAAYMPFPIVAGLIEAQTIGRISKLAPDPRRVTRTDAAMVAPLIDGMLERYDDLLEEAGVAPWARGYRFGTMMDSARLLSLALKAPDFHVIRFSLDLAAAREGEVMMLFPVEEHPAVNAAGGSGGARLDGALEAQILQAPTELRAVLHRLSMPLSAVSALKVGEVLTIPRDALAHTDLEVGAQTVIGTVRLGQINGMRAIRLNLPGVVSDAVVPEAAPPAPVHLSVVAPQAPAPTPMPVMEEPEDDYAFTPAPAPRTDDFLGDLPDLGDLPGMGDDAEEELPDLGFMPMSALPVID